MSLAPLSRRTVALHTCCGPCLLEPYDALAGEGWTVTVVFYNPNISPATEYERRLATLLEHTAARGIGVVELPYEASDWEASAGGREAAGRARCRACYRLRIGAVARWASAHGFDAVATTLTVSPYQDPVAIAEEGRLAAAAAGIAYLDRDFRDRYPEALRRSREAGMYRQNYCGCAPSAAEAPAAREARKARRQRAAGT